MRQQKIRTLRYSLTTALYRAPQLWSIVPADLMSLLNVVLFKSKNSCLDFLVIYKNDLLER